MGPLGLGLGLGTRAARPLPGFDFAGALPAGATLTRASAGSRWAASGLLVSEGADVARFDHDPATLAPRGLLIEGAATNAIPWSARLEQFSEPANCAVAADAATAPDGATAMDRLMPAGSAVPAYVAETGSAKTAATTYTLSAFAQAENLRWLSLSGDLYANQRMAWFDLATRTVGTVSGNAIAASVTAVGAATVRVALTFTGTTSVYNVVAPQTGDGAISGTFAAGDGLLVWGVMLEAGASASSYVPTVGAAATRAADRLTLDWAGRGAPDGPAQVRYTFDDGTQQTVAATIADGKAGVPTNLNRRWLRRAEII